MTLQPSNAPQKPTIAILGSGIIGLQIALSILTSPALSQKYLVTIIAAHLPNSQPSINFTSPWAGAQWRSHAPAGERFDEVREWDRRTYEEWRRWLREGESGVGEGQMGDGGKAARSREELEKYMGLGIRESLLLWSTESPDTEGKNGEGLWWRDAVEGFKILGDLDAEMELEAMARTSLGHMDGQVRLMARYETVCVNVPRYLEYLMESVQALGGTFKRATIETEGGVEGVVGGLAKIGKVVRPGSEVDAVVLAAGLLSKAFLPKVEADKLYPVRGQTLLVKGEARRAITEVMEGGEISYIIPRPGSGTTIIGGCKEVGSWNDKEDIELTRKMLARAKALDPQLLPREKLEVLSVQVGRRPGRIGGPRVEMEIERVGGVRVVYAYGHEGAGYQGSVGTAENVVRLLSKV